MTLSRKQKRIRKKQQKSEKKFLKKQQEREVEPFKLPKLKISGTGTYIPPQE